MRRLLERDGASGTIVKQITRAPQAFIEILGVRKDMEEQPPILWEAGTLYSIPIGVDGCLLRVVTAWIQVP